MGTEKGAAKEKLIYIHVVNWGVDAKDPRFDEDRDARYVGASNDWYVIKQKGDEAAQISRVFDDIKQVNYPDAALLDTGCEVIGSSIYVIGGLNVLTKTYDFVPANRACNAIRCLDTRNPSDGWKTCSTLPFSCTMPRSASTSTSTSTSAPGSTSTALVQYDGGRWLFLFCVIDYNGDRPCGYAVNVDGYGDSYPISRPTNLSYFRPALCASLSPGTFHALDIEVQPKKMGKSVFYQFDCSKHSWTSHQLKMDNPIYPRSFVGGHAVSDDGIYYVYDSINLKLLSFDLADQLKELPSVDLPRTKSFGCWLGVSLFVLAKDKFCVISHDCGDDFGERSLFYSRFSVSYLTTTDGKPTVTVEESRTFTISCFEVLNIVSMDSCSDGMAESLSCNC